MDLREKLWISKQEGIKEGLEQGWKQGFELGFEQGHRQIAELIVRMAADSRQDELAAVLADESRVKKELRRYGIGNEN